MQTMDISTAGFCRFHQTTGVLKRLFCIPINQEIDSLKDIHMQYLHRKLSVENCRGKWSIKEGENHLKSLKRKYKRLRRGPSETLVLSGDQF